MPTVLRAGGFSFGFYSDDHDPPHVHAFYSGDRAVIEIQTRYVRKVLGMRDPDVARAQAIIEEHQQALLTAWMEWQSQKRK
jgi:hypothetical protein